MKRGFTLTELLDVIVIISLIAVPIVLNIINGHFAEGILGEVDKPLLDVNVN